MIDFFREDRYIVLKKTDIEKLPPIVGEMLYLLEDEVNIARHKSNKQNLECVVVESDWPEYELVWQMIENRMTDKPTVQNLFEALDKMVKTGYESDELEYKKACNSVVTLFLKFKGYCDEEIF